MGNMRHYVVVVTHGTQHEAIETHQKACRLFENRVTEIIKSEVNGYYSYMIPTSGSKKGRNIDTIHREARNAFLDYLSRYSKNHETKAVEVHYGDEEPQFNKLLRTIDS